MAVILLLHDAFAPGQDLVGVIRHLPPKQELKLRLLGAALVYDRMRANPKTFNASQWIGHASAMEHGFIVCDIKIPLSEPDANGCVSFRTPVPQWLLPSFSSAYNTAFVTVSYGVCLHSAGGEVLAVEPVTISQNAPEESAQLNRKTRLATFVTRNLNWYYHNNHSSYLAATVDMDEVDNLTSGSTLSLRLHARSGQQVKSLRFTVEQRLELSLPYDGKPRRVKQRAIIASSVRELQGNGPFEFKKRYFITMPTLCTTMSSQIISTKYTVRIQMTSSRTAMLTLEIPVTMYSKDSFINGLPSPASNPGLTAQFANIILDSHQKNLADECAICFSEISHEFMPPELGVSDENEVDVASCGTAESDDFAPSEHQRVFRAGDFESGATLGDASTSHAAKAAPRRGPRDDEDEDGSVTPSRSSGGCDGAARALTGQGSLDGRRPTDSPSAGEEEGASVVADALATLTIGPEALDRAGDGVTSRVEPGGAEPEQEGVIDIHDGRHPDAIAADIMAQPPHLCTREQLELLYKTCRYREVAMLKGVAYASCGHAFHPLCLLEYEKHAGHRSGGDSKPKCPLCRQPYTTKHFIPDDNLRALCLEHTLQDAMAAAEAAAKEAEEKAKEAITARNAAAQALRNASRLRQQAGSALRVPGMGDRISALMQMTSTMSGNGTSGAASDAPRPALRPTPGLHDAQAPASLRAPRTHPRRPDVGASALMGAARPVLAASDGRTPAAAAVEAAQDGTDEDDRADEQRGVHRRGLPASQGPAQPPRGPLPADVAAMAAQRGREEDPPAAPPQPDAFQGGRSVRVHEQVAMMGISDDVRATAAMHPEVVLDSDDVDVEEL